jgi:Fe-S-cluster containining protein
MEDNFTCISSKDSFRFSCGPHISCFNECCRDLNQFLTPYDILRLRSFLKVSSEEFLTRYTAQHTGPETGLPIVGFRQKHDDALKCPFVSEDGCLVYSDRPSSCRAYPVARAVSRNRQTGQLTEYFMLLKEPHCKGFQNGNFQSVEQWIENQGLKIYNEMNDLMMEIISLKNRLFSGPLDLKTRHFFHMACYDLDAFREKILNKGHLESPEYDELLLLKAKTEDTALLKISLQWIQTILLDQSR